MLGEPTVPQGCFLFPSRLLRQPPLAAHLGPSPHLVQCTWPHVPLPGTSARSRAFLEGLGSDLTSRRSLAHFPGIDGAFLSGLRLTRVFLAVVPPGSRGAAKPFCLNPPTQPAAAGACSVWAFPDSRLPLFLKSPQLPFTTRTSPTGSSVCRSLISYVLAPHQAGS